VKVFISCDIEGISGVVHGDHCGSKGKDYDRARALMTGEVNAAIEAALEVGATKVVVNDSHGSMRNIIIEELHREALLITGSPKALSMMEGIDPEFDAALFIGYHSRAQTPGVLNHTYSGSTVANLNINGIDMGETGMNALIAGWYDVPIALVAGDSSVVAEAKDLLGPDVAGVAVKEARGRYAAMCLQPAKAREAIFEGVEQALKHLDGLKPFTLPAPYVFRLTFFNTAMADGAMLIPGAERVDHITVEYSNDDYIVAFKAMRAMISLAYS